MPGSEDGCAAAVEVACDYCEAGHEGLVYETIIGRRLHWVLTHECPHGMVEAMGWDRSPEEYREAILRQGGLYRLSWPSGLGGERVAVLKQLREHGMALSEVKAGLEQGVLGTRTEMTLLARRIEAATSVQCSVDAHA